MLASLFGKKKTSSGIFVPAGKKFNEITDEIANTSINGISEHLGYNTDQVQTYFGNFDQDADVQQVIFEVFTKNIVFVLTKKHVTQLSKSKVDHFLRAFDLLEVYDSVAVEDILQTGIDNESLTIDFLGRVLQIQDPAPDGVYHVPSINRYLYFNGGLLTDFGSADGLNKWARHLKELNANLIDRYERVAKKYWGDDSRKIAYEINAQAQAWADIPHNIKNPFLNLHKAELDTTNYLMLLVCHHDKAITLQEFQQINHGRYQETVNSTDTLFEYHLGRFTYRFLPTGSLFDVAQYG